MLIEMIGLRDQELTKCLIEEVYAAGGNPFLEFRNPEVTRSLMLGGTEALYAQMAELELARMKKNARVFGRSQRRQHYRNVRCTG